MTRRDFFNRVAHGREDVLQDFVDLLARNRIEFCVIGGLAVNAYAEPVVSLDLDVVIVSDRRETLLKTLKTRGYAVRTFPNSVNVSKKKSDVRIQIQADVRYQPFLKRAVAKDVLGYRLPVAAVEDVLQGKIWAAEDPERRPSKRQKDLADILRLIETKPNLTRLIPSKLKKSLKMKWPGS